MTVKRLFLAIIFLITLPFISKTAAGQPYYSINKEGKKIYTLITELRFDKAKKQLVIAQKKDPDNLFLVYLENYIDFFTIMITEDTESFKTLEKQKALRISRLKKGNDADPYYRLLQAEVHIQWALVRLKFGENFTAAREIRTAYGLLKENNLRHPHFTLNKKGMSMIHAAIGTVPEKYQFLLKMVMGMEGDIKSSEKEVTELINYCKTNDHLFLGEAEVIQSFIQLFFNNDAQGAWQTIIDSSLDMDSSPLACYVYAIVAQRSGRTDKAISVLEALERRPDQEKFHYLEYMLGLNKLRKLDTSAKTHLLRFTRQYKGYNYIKKAFQLLAWHSLVLDRNEDLAKYYYRACINEGNLIVDSDKSAHKEAESGELPDPLLLRIRLLFDGGYNQASLQLIESNQNYLVKNYPLEYYYRLGRNHQALQEYNKALHAYDNLLNLPGFSKEYQICNAALQCGIIYEKLGNNTKSIYYYKMCISIDPDDYKTSLHGKAKAGLERLKE